MQLKKTLQRYIYKEYYDITSNTYDESIFDYDNLLMERIIIKKYFFSMYFFLSGFYKVIKFFCFFNFFLIFFLLGFPIEFLYIIFYLILFFFFKLLFFFFNNKINSDLYYKFIKYSLFFIYNFYKFTYFLFFLSKIIFNLLYKFLYLFFFCFLFISNYIIFIIFFRFYLYYENLQFYYFKRKKVYLYIFFLCKYFIFFSNNFIFLYNYNYIKKIIKLKNKLKIYFKKILKLIKFLYILSLRKNLFTVEDIFFYDLWNDIEPVDNDYKRHKPNYKFVRFFIERFYFGINHFIIWCFYRFSYIIVITPGLYIHYIIWRLRIYDTKMYFYMYYVPIERFLKWLRYLIWIYFFEKNYKINRLQIFFDLSVYFSLFLWNDLFLYFFKIKLILEFFFNFFKNQFLLIKFKVIKFICDKIIYIYINNFIKYIFFFFKYIFMFLKSLIIYFIKFNHLIIRFLSKLKNKKYRLHTYKKIYIFLFSFFFNFLYFFYYFYYYFYFLKKLNSNNYFFFKKIHKDLKFFRFNKDKDDKDYSLRLNNIILKKYKSIHHYKRFKSFINFNYKIKDLYLSVKLEKNFIKNLKKLYKTMEPFEDEQTRLYNALIGKRSNIPNTYTINDYYKYYTSLKLYKNSINNNHYKKKRNNYFISLKKK